MTLKDFLDVTNSQVKVTVGGQTAGPWAVSGTLSAGGFTAIASGSFVRGAGTNQYTASTAVAASTGAGSSLAFAGATRTGGPNTGQVMGAIMLDAANQTTKGQFELWLFTAQPASPVADNANWAPTAVDLQNLCGVISFSTAFVGNNGSGAAGNVIFVADLAPSPTIPYKIASGSSLYGMMVVRNAYTPVDREAFSITLTLNQD